jgi:hypothetical protein
MPFLSELFDAPLTLPDGTIVDRLHPALVGNVFCRTGPGGGIDPSCSPHEQLAARYEEQEKGIHSAHDAEEKLTQREHRQEDKEITADRRKEDRQTAKERDGEDRQYERERDRHRARIASKEDRRQAGELATAPATEHVAIKAKYEERFKKLFYKHQAEEDARAREVADYRLSQDVKTAQRRREEDTRRAALRDTGRLSRLDQRAKAVDDLWARHGEEEAKLPAANAFCPTGPGGKVDDSCPPHNAKGAKQAAARKKGKEATSASEEPPTPSSQKDVAANRPSKPEERVPGARPPSLPDKVKPPAPTGKSKAPKNAEGKPTTGYSANGIANTYTGDLAENALSKLNMRNILPEGKRSHGAGEVAEKGSSLDREHDHSGVFFEVKTVCVEASEYKAKPKAEEMEDKRRFADIHQGKAATMVVVMNTDKLEAHAYWREGIGAFAINPDKLDDWHYAGHVKLDSAVVEEARRKTQAAIEKRQEAAKRKKKE